MTNTTWPVEIGEQGIENVLQNSYTWREIRCQQWKHRRGCWKMNKLSKKTKIKMYLIKNNVFSVLCWRSSGQSWQRTHHNDVLRHGTEVQMHLMNAVTYWRKNATKCMLSTVITRSKWLGSFGSTVWAHISIARQLDAMSAKMRLIHVQRLMVCKETKLSVCNSIANDYRPKRISLVAGSWSMLLGLGTPISLSAETRSASVHHVSLSVSPLSMALGDNPRLSIVRKSRLH